MHKINLRRIDYGGIFLYLFLTVFGLIMLLPLVYMAVTALKPTSELFLFPRGFS